MEHILKLEGVGLKIREKCILGQVNLELKKGQTVCLVGKNGSGKSSLLKILSRQLYASEGQVWFNGKLLRDYQLKEFSKDLVSLSQDMHQTLFSEMSIIENAMLYRMRFESVSLLPIVQADYDHYQQYLTSFNPKLSHDLDKKVEYLSGGEKQVLALALCLEFKPKLLLLDEFTSALDPKTADFVFNFTCKKIKEEGVACIMVSHNPDQIAKFSSDIVTMEEGRVVDV